MQTETQINPIEIINSVNLFYEIAWNHLLWFVGVAGAIIGVAVPYLLHLNQRRLSRIEEQSIKRELDTHVDKIRADIEKSIDQKFIDESKHIETKFSALDEKISKELAGAQGGIFFIQAKVNKEKKQYGFALRSYVRSASNFLHADSQDNLQKASAKLKNAYRIY